MSGRDDVELSLVLPVYDECESLRTLLDEILPVLEDLAPAYEVVFVDDGSQDGSSAQLDELARLHPTVRVLRLDRNHGLSAALHCGFRAARGEILAMMDSDGQLDPRDLPSLVDVVRRGDADMACGWRRERHDSFVKRASSRVANSFRNLRTSSSIRDVTCPLKAFRRDVRDAFLPFDGMHRFLPTLAEMAGFSVVEVPVRHRPRRGGTSKYGVWNRVFRGMVDLRAIRWMQRRRLSYRVVSVGEEES